MVDFLVQEFGDKHIDLQIVKTPLQAIVQTVSSGHLSN